MADSACPDVAPSPSWTPRARYGVFPSSITMFAGWIAAFVLVTYELTALAGYVAPGSTTRRGRELWIVVAWGIFLLASTFVDAVRRVRNRSAQVAPATEDEHGPVAYTALSFVTSLDFAGRSWPWLVPAAGLSLYAGWSQILFLGLVPVTVWVIYVMFQLAWAGRTTVRYVGRPYRCGETARFLIGGTAPGSISDGRVLLRGRRESTRAPLVLAQPLARPTPDSEVEVALDVPADTPPTRVGLHVEQVYWTLEVRGRYMGAPYVARFPMWLQASADETA